MFLNIQVTNMTCVVLCVISYAAGIVTATQYIRRQFKKSMKKIQGMDFDKLKDKVFQGK